MKAGSKIAFCFFAAFIFILFALPVAAGEIPEGRVFCVKSRSSQDQENNSRTRTISAGVMWQ